MRLRAQYLVKGALESPQDSPGPGPLPGTGFTFFRLVRMRHESSLLTKMLFDWFWHLTTWSSLVMHGQEASLMLAVWNEDYVRKGTTTPERTLCSILFLSNAKEWIRAKNNFLSRNTVCLSSGSE